MVLKFLILVGIVGLTLMILFFAIPIIKWINIFRKNTIEKQDRIKFLIVPNSEYRQPQLGKVIQIIERLTFNILGIDFKINAHVDKLNNYGRIYLQIAYFAPCTKTGVYQEWVGRKWYLSEFMTDDEVIKTAYAACKATVEHEIMEGFKVDNIILFNPHINYKELLAISHKEITRTNN